MKSKTSQFVIAVAAVLAMSLVSTDSAKAVADQHHDQAPGYYRLYVGDLEVTALYDGTGSFDPSWLIGKKSVIDATVAVLKKQPHFLDDADDVFLVNTGKRLILLDTGTGGWWGGPAFGRVEASLRQAGYTHEQVDLVLLTHMHSDHIGGLTTNDGKAKRIYPNAEVYVAKAESDFWLSPENAAKAPKEAQGFFTSAQAISAPYIKAGKWHTFSDTDEIAEGVKIVPLHGHTPGHTGYEFSSKGQKILFWGDIIHAAIVQLQHPEVHVGFDIDPVAAVAQRKRLLSTLAGENTLVAGPHMPYPGIGYLLKEGNAYGWASVVYTDQLAPKQ